MRVKHIDDELRSLESLVKSDNLSETEQEQLSEKYLRFLDRLEEARTNTLDNEKLDDFWFEVGKRVKLISRNIQDPNHWAESALAMMFPDEESLEGFDVDDLFDRD